MRRGSGHLLLFVGIGALCLASVGCAHPEPRAAAPVHETPDEVVKSCDRPGAMAACRAAVDKLWKLVAGEHSDGWFASQAFDLRAGNPHELPADVVRIARAVAWERSVNEHFEVVDALSRDLADYNKRDARWKLSNEGETFFVDRTLRRSLAAEEGGYEFRRLLGKFVERVDGIAARGAAPTDQPPPRREVAHETPDDMVNECRAASTACSATIKQLKMVVAVEKPDDWFWQYAVLLRTRTPGSPSDAVRAARAVAWEPSVTEHLNRVDALSRDIATSQASKDLGDKASVADRTQRKALAIQEAGREFKRLLGELVARLEQIAT